MIKIHGTQVKGKNMQKDIGQVLCVAKANTPIIILALVIRLAFATMFTLAFASSGINLSVGILIAITFLIAIIPLTYFKYELAFHEYGFTFKGKSWTFEEITDLVFVKGKTNYEFFPRTRMRTNVKVFDVTYVKDAPAAYQKAYMKTI